MTHREPKQCREGTGVTSVGALIADRRNEKAARRYLELVTVLGMVTAALEQLEQLIRRSEPATSWAAGGWRVASHDELVFLMAKALNDLSALKAQTRRHKAELKSKEWNV